MEVLSRYTLFTLFENLTPDESFLSATNPRTTCCSLLSLFLEEKVANCPYFEGQLVLLAEHIVQQLQTTKIEFQQRYPI